MDNKGVEPILATVLIVLVVIALAGTFLVWSQRTFTTGAERGTQETQRVSSATGEAVKIDAITCGSTDNITVRNLGSEINTADLSLFVNDTLTTVTWTPTGARAQYTLTHTTTSNIFYSGNNVRVVTKNGASDSARCA